ncbi:DgyrCDS2077 [Dimorphilus gyrociliatus]|uniref:DgyrCDS2077 n=1 Tax=Dimorphilus gyrociliatus TaxID=2664684 RepID=A0A7I8VAZ8_9ANNE|nr:DgyrCDS2077 [Dimorphilus gyrociliatus]
MAEGEDRNNEQPEEELAMDPVIKHPLENCWAIWFFKNDKAKDWASNLKRIAAFDTVEDFWALFNHIMPASKLAPGCDYSLFKDGVQPMWEDEKNKNGGRWLINLVKNQRSTELDKFWLETLLCMIGEAFGEYGHQICGATINIRTKGDKLGLWTQNSTDELGIVSIGKTLKERLNMNRSTMGYQAHADTMSKTGSTAKNRYVV